MMHKIILPLIIAALAIPAAVMAAPGGGPGKGMRGSLFQQMDSNGDGVITAEEHAASAAERFAAMDTNGDGKLTQDEIRQQRQKNCPAGMNCPRGNQAPMGNQGQRKGPMNQGN